MMKIKEMSFGARCPGTENRVMWYIMEAVKKI